MSRVGSPYAEDTLANEKQSLAKLSTANKCFGHTTPFYEFCATNEASLWEQENCLWDYLLLKVDDG